VDDSLHAPRAVADEAGTLLRLEGRDALDLLHRISTQALDQLEPGTSHATLFCDFRGRLQHRAVVAVASDGAVWLLRADAPGSELAATVDYLFGYDATAGVVPDWMYEQLAASYVFDEETRSFMRQSNPWALRGITERLLEAASRGLWEAPDAKTLDQLRQIYLDMEGDLESRGTEES